jgi:glycosyltransferase involved in cell wall biosynthesis
LLKKPVSTTHPKTRVLFAIGSMAGGGAERQVVEYLRHLDRNRFVPLLYLIAKEGELLGDVPNDVQVLSFSERCRYPRINLPGRIHRRQVKDLSRVLDTERIDVVCSVTLLATLVAQGAVARRPTAMVCVEMSDPRLDFQSTVKRFSRSKKRLLAKAYADAQVVVAVSNGVREGIEEFYGVPAANMTTIPNFVDLARIDALAAGAAPLFAAGRRHIVSLGRLHPVKGHRHLLEAIDELVNSRGHSDLTLHLIGDGPERVPLEQFVHARGLTEHVDFVGFVQNPFPYLKHADLYCLPSLYEGLPLALVEALACRVPVIATDCPSGPREVLAGGKYGTLVPPGDSSALATACEQALAETGQDASVAEAGRRFVQLEYSVPACMSRLEQAFDDACARSIG